MALETDQGGPDMSAFVEIAPFKETEEIQIRPATNRDIPNVNTLYYREYGLGYPYPLGEELPADGISLIAERDGVIAGFARATPSHYDDIWELGRMIVDPAFRRHGVAKRLTQLRLEKALAAGVPTVFSEPICWGGTCASQNNLLSHWGFRVSGLHPFKYPSIATDFHGEQPGSVVVCVLSLLPTVRRRRYLSPTYERLVQDVLHMPSHTDPTEIAEGMPGIVRHSPLFCQGRRGADFVDIPANWPEAIAITEAYYRQGYRFSAFLQGFGRTPSGQRFDCLRLYRPPLGATMTFDRVQVIPQLLPLKRFMENEQA